MAQYCSTTRHLPVLQRCSPQIWDNTILLLAVSALEFGSESKTDLNIPNLDKPLAGNDEALGHAVCRSIDRFVKLLAVVFMLTETSLTLIQRHARSAK